MVGGESTGKALVIFQAKTSNTKINNKFLKMKEIYYYG